MSDQFPVPGTENILGQFRNNTSELAVLIDDSRKRAQEEGLLDVRELMCGDINRIRYVSRYSTSLVLHRENVAEHSYYVCLYAMMICSWLDNGKNEGIDELSVLRRAILHDLEECRTGDFQRPFKQQTPELQEAIEEAARREFEDLIQALFPGNLSFAEWATNLWANSKDETKEGCVIALADYLSVISHLYAETSCANFSVMQHYKSLMQYTKRFDASKYDFLRPLIVQSREIFDGMISGANLQGKIRDL